MRKYNISEDMTDHKRWKTIQLQLFVRQAMQSKHTKYRCFRHSCI